MPHFCAVVPLPAVLYTSRRLANFKTFRELLALRRGKTSCIWLAAFLPSWRPPAGGDLTYKAAAAALYKAGHAAPASWPRTAFPAYFLPFFHEGYHIPRTNNICTGDQRPLPPPCWPAWPWLPAAATAGPRRARAPAGQPFLPAAPARRGGIYYLPGNDLYTYRHHPTNCSMPFSYALAFQLQPPPYAS